MFSRPTGVLQPREVAATRSKCAGAPTMCWMCDGESGGGVDGWYSVMDGLGENKVTTGASVAVTWFAEKSEFFL